MSVPAQCTELMGKASGPQLELSLERHHQKSGRGSRLTQYQTSRESGRSTKKGRWMRCSLEEPWATNLSPTGRWRHLCTNSFWRRHCSEHSACFWDTAHLFLEPVQVCDHMHELSAGNGGRWLAFRGATALVFTISLGNRRVFATSYHRVFNILGTFIRDGPE